MSSRTIARVLGGAILVAVWGTACGGSDSPVAVQTTELRVFAECSDNPAQLEPAVWQCPEPRVVECRERAEPDAQETMFVVPEGGTCDQVNVATDPGPYGLGTHRIVAVETSMDAAADADAADAGSASCEATLRIIDTTPPEVEEHLVTLWPPNHHWERIDPERCVTVLDACDPDAEARFLWVSSDEPADATGDGHQEHDIAIDSCGTVHVRAERQGGGDGRVYRIGWRARDDSGNATQGVCTVEVPHDQRGDHAQAGEAVLYAEAPGGACEEHQDDDEEEDDDKDKGDVH